MKLFPENSPVLLSARATAADAIARALDGECARRVALHRELFNATWRSRDYTPEELFAALGTGAALFLAVAGESVEHLSRLAAATGQSLTDYLPESDFVPPREYTIAPDGTVTLAPEEE